MGSMLALSSIALGTFFNDWGLPAVAAIVLTLAFGALLGGGVNGVLDPPVRPLVPGRHAGHADRLPRGGQPVWSNARTELAFSPLLDSIAFDNFLAIPIPVWIMAGTFRDRPLRPALDVLRARRLRRGRVPDAARLSGINVSRNAH